MMHQQNQTKPRLCIPGYIYPGNTPAPFHVNGKISTKSFGGSEIHLHHMEQVGGHETPGGPFPFSSAHVKLTWTRQKLL